ncbi:hypothetical protein CEXT_80501, partial [Caerostris extrusa]
MLAICWFKQATNLQRSQDCQWKSAGSGLSYIESCWLNYIGSDIGYVDRIVTLVLSDGLCLRAKPSVQLVASKRQRIHESTMSAHCSRFRVKGSRADRCQPGRLRRHQPRAAAARWWCR